MTVGLPQHADQHRPERPILLAVDQDTRRGRHGTGYRPVPGGASSLRSWSRLAKVAVTWALREVLAAGTPDSLELFPGDLDMRVVAPVLL
jgi:hypothetical protein